MKTRIASIVAVLASLLTGCAAFTEHSTGLRDGQLSDCPAWPRCVSSDSRIDDKQVAPLRITGAPPAAWRAAREVVANMDRTTIVDERADYIHAEVISPWHVYTDDLELHLRAAQGIIAIRSSGRIGYYDFNVNRDRVETVRAKLAERGVVAGADAQ